MASPYDNNPGKIFIGGIPPITSQETIQRYFEQFGELCDCVLMQDKATGKSRGFGFVTYRSSKDVDKVLTKNHSIDGKQVDCKRAVPRDQQGEYVKEDTPVKTRKLFVGGLPQAISEEQFRQYFEQYGPIEDSVIMVDKDSGKSRGFGFVTYQSEESVDQVIARYYENKIDGKWVECKRAQPKDMGAVPSKKGPGGRGKDFSGPGGKGGHGYYQDNSSTKSSRSQYTQDTYGGGDDSFSGGYMQNVGKNNPYENTGYPNQGFGDFNGYNAAGFPNPYDPNYGGYNPGFAGGYPNAYPGNFNNAYGGYNAGFNQYMGQGFPNNNPNYGYDPSQQMNANYGYGGGYGYNNQGRYGNENYNNNQGFKNSGGSQNGGNGNNNVNQEASNNQSNQMIPDDDQQSVGPVKPSFAIKKQGIKERHYNPY